MEVRTDIWIVQNVSVFNDRKFYNPSFLIKVENFG